MIHKHAEFWQERSGWSARLAEAAAQRPALTSVAFVLSLLCPTLLSQNVDAGDTLKYHAAARCVAQNLVCIADTHWETRWPVFWPTGMLFRVFGESRSLLGLFPLIQVLAAVAFFAVLIRRCFGREPALVGGLLFAAMPMTTHSTSRLSADILEFVFLLAGALALTMAQGRARAGPLLLGGAFFALAVETRTTALVPGVAVALALMFLRWPFRAFVLIGMGGAIVLAGSALFQLWLTGDPFHSYRLAIAHTSVPTNALPPGTDTSNGPFFNLELIRNWQQPLRVHWAIDPFVNLMINEWVGALFTASLAVLALCWRSFVGSSARAREFRLLGFSSAGVFLTIVFGLSIHPTPRMFIPVWGALTAMLALALTGPRQDLKRVVLYATIPLMAVQGVGKRLLSSDPVFAERTASRWLREAEGKLSTNEITSNTLYLAPDVAALPIDEHGRGLHLILVKRDCAASGDNPRHWPAVREARIPHSRAIFFDAFGPLVPNYDNTPWRLCLFDRSGT